MNIEHQTPIDQRLLGVFLCTQLPSEIPAWITVEDRVIEPGYWGWFAWHDEHIQLSIEQSVEWLNILPIYLASLGFEGVEVVEWRTIDEQNLSIEWQA